MTSSQLAPSESSGSPEPDEPDYMNGTDRSQQNLQRTSTDRLQQGIENVNYISHEDLDTLADQNRGNAVPTSLVIALGNNFSEIF